MKNLSIIACISRDRGLGQDDRLLWHIPEDMKFFRETTSGHPVIMGRKTYASIGRPLPHRENIVLSRSDLSGDGITVYHDSAALDAYLEADPREKFVIGGAMLYNMYIDRTETIYLTEVDAVRPADTFFPEFDRTRFTRRVLQTGTHEGITYKIVAYTRRS